VWRAEIDGRRLRFHLAGINNQNFIMQDEETGSWWQQVTGEAIQGPLKGKRLDLVFHDEIPFGQWKREHPGTRVLRPDRVAGRLESADWEEGVARLPVVVARMKGDPMAPRDLVAGVRLGGAARAYPFTALKQQSPVLDTVGSVPIVLIVGEEGRSVRAFERRVDGRELQIFKRPGSSPPVFVDAETGSTWSAAGEAVSGPLQGKKLPKVYVLKDYWFDWRAYNPGTTVYALQLR
jgi:uncharacterized protein DUF3179